MPDPIATLIATVPDLQSACSVSGDGSARIKLDVPESSLPEVMKLIAFGRGKALEVRIYAVQSGDKASRSGNVRRVGVIPDE